MPAPASTNTLRDTLLIGFCAMFMLGGKMLLRLNLGIPGHAMFLTVFFLILPRAITGRRYAATLTGFATGLGAVLLGVGKGGPLLLLKFLPPALTIDLAFFLFPAWSGSFVFCSVIGFIAAATRMMGVVITDYLVGMDTAVIAAHAFIKTLGGCLFGTLGGLAAAPIINKLRTRGMISAAR